MMEKKEYIFANDVGDATMIVYDVFQVFNWYIIPFI